MKKVLVVLLILAGCRTDKPAASVFFGTYQASGTLGAGDQQPLDADVCGSMSSTSTTTWTGDFSVAAGSASGRVLITDVANLCSFEALQDTPGVFVATDAD